MGQNYIGVYATKEKSPTVGDYPRPLSARKRQWFVWEMPDGKYKVQAMNAAHQPMAEARFVTSKEFSSRFTYEAECFIAPEGYTHPSMQGVDVSAMSLPDLFLDEKIGGILPPTADHGTLLADDPDLLVNWARAERRPKLQGVDPVKMPFDRLIGEVGGEPDESVSSSIPETLEEAAAQNSEAADDETHQVRQLRSRFVQALLLLRRGARAESLTLLEEILQEPHEPFEGGAQLFSEFGLGLRRLGFAPLALAAHKRALKFAPDDERILFNIARSYHDLGLVPEARDYLEQALAAAPAFMAARQFLAFLDEPETKNTEE